MSITYPYWMFFTKKKEREKRKLKLKAIETVRLINYFRNYNKMQNQSKCYKTNEKEKMTILVPFLAHVENKGKHHEHNLNFMKYKNVSVINKKIFMIRDST